MCCHLVDETKDARRVGLARLTGQYICFCCTSPVWLCWTENVFQSSCSGKFDCEIILRGAYLSLLTDFNMFNENRKPSKGTLQTI